MVLSPKTIKLMAKNGVGHSGLLKAISNGKEKKNVQK